jgi:transposase
MQKNMLGIDVGKFELSIFWKTKNYTVKNDIEEIAVWFEKYAVSEKEASLVVYEPTGGYERTLEQFLQINKWSHKRVHANHVRAYARALGVHAKTDRVDARMIADYAVRMEIKANETKMEHTQLKALLTRREQLVCMRAEEKNRLDTCDPALKSFINQHITQLGKYIAKIDEEIKKYEKANPEVHKEVALYSSVPGIGRIIALQLVTDLPELKTADNKKLAALVGVAPWNRDSGLMIGRRSTYGGRTRVRGLLYMGALVAARCCPQLKQFYLKLKQKGKATKVALVAVAHKLLDILHSVAKRQTPWVAVLNN